MPRSSATATDETRRRLLRAAGRGFRKYGFGGLGVDAVAEDAGVTSGAFYSHFESKAAVFREALGSGLSELRDGIVAAHTNTGAGWLRKFATWYLSPERRADLAGSCTLPTLTLEAARADADTREVYDLHLREVIAAMASGMHGKNREGNAITALVLLSGGLAITHAVEDPKLATRIARAVVTAVATLEKDD